jgi:hypothetical protein
MCCYKPGGVSRLIYRPRRHRKYRDKGHNSFAWSDYRDLVVRAHIQLKAPVDLPPSSSGTISTPISPPGCASTRTLTTGSPSCN